MVLAREDAGAERIFQNNGVPLLLDMLETGKVEMVLAAIRTFAGMCTGHKARVRGKAKTGRCIRDSVRRGANSPNSWSFVTDMDPFQSFYCNV